MNRPLLWIVDHPVLAAGLLVLLTLALARAKSRFGSDTLTVVLVKAQNVFTAPVLHAIRRISDGLDGVEGVTRVESLTTVKNIKGEGTSLSVEPLVGPTIPTAPSDLERIRRDALANRVF